MAYRTRELLVRQRTRTVNALRGHLAEYGVIAPIGIAHVEQARRGRSRTTNRRAARGGRDAGAHAAGAGRRVERADRCFGERRCASAPSADETARRLMKIPGVGAIVATALTTFAPPPETFSKGRDFAAWAGLTPRQHSSGGKARLGKISKTGQRDIRRLLIIGAVGAVRWAVRKGAPGGLVAGADAGEETADAGRRRAGQPHGARRLGADAQGRGLPGSGGRGRIGLGSSGDVGDVSRAREA